MPIDPGSFRDPDSAVFTRQGAVLRGLSARGLADWERLAATDFFGRLTAAGSLVGTTVAGRYVIDRSDLAGPQARGRDLPGRGQPVERVRVVSDIEQPLRKALGHIGRKRPVILLVAQHACEGVLAAALGEIAVDHDEAGGLLLPVLYGMRPALLPGRTELVEYGTLVCLGRMELKAEVAETAGIQPAENDIKRGHPAMNGTVQNPDKIVKMQVAADAQG